MGETIENKTYDVHFNYLYGKYDKFKQKDVDILNAILSGSRMGQYLNIEGYGELTFDEYDSKNEFGKIVNISDSFDRRKTNCIMIDLFDSDLNPDKYYDKMFVHMHNVSIGQNINYSFGFIMYDSKNDKCVQIPNTTGDLNEIVLYINRIMINIVNKIKIEKQFKEKCML